MDNITRNTYIALLEVGVDKIREGITYNEMLGYLKDKGLLENDNGDARLKTVFESLFETKMVLDQLEPKRKNNNTTKYILKATAFFSYLQFKEYQHSLSSSKKAMILSFWAIGITLVSLASSIIFNIINIYIS